VLPTLTNPPSASLLFMGTITRESVIVIASVARLTPTISSLILVSR
jgi:hypothetical protein